MNTFFMFNLLSGGPGSEVQIAARLIADPGVLSSSPSPAT